MPNADDCYYDYDADKEVLIDTEAKIFEFGATKDDSRKKVMEMQEESKKVVGKGKKKRKRYVTAQDCYDCQTVMAGGGFCCANMAAQWTRCIVPGCCDKEDCECHEECERCPDDGCVAEDMDDKAARKWLVQEVKRVKTALKESEDALKQTNGRLRHIIRSQ